MSRPDLSAAKRELLARELARRRQQGPATIPVRPAGAPPDLALAQQRLWLLDRLSPDQPIYNASLTMRIAGPLDVGLLHEALDAMVARHEALRTVGVEGPDGEPRGVLLDEGVGWAEHDADEAALPRLLMDAARAPFDLSRDVLLRATLFRLIPDGSPAEYVLILVSHHIATDGMSRDIMFAEITEYYNARRRGRPPALPALAVQYGDYARWQKTLDWQRNDDFWRAELAGADFALDLPADLPREPRRWHQGERVAMDGPAGSGDALRALARSERATFFMAMTAAGGAFLSGLTATGADVPDVVLGSPVANRQRPELERLIGFFVNTVILRVRLHGDPTFRELIGRCRQTAIACFAHQDMPLDRLVELINPVRVPGRNPLFQVNFRMQGVAPPPPQLDGLTVTRMITETGASRFELAFGLVDQPGAVRGYLEYAFDLFRRPTIDAWQAAFVDLIGRVVADPDLPMSQLRPLVRADIDRRRQQAAAAAAPAARTIRRRR